MHVCALSVSDSSKRAQPKSPDLDVVVCVDEDVVGLKVAVDNHAAVQSIDAQQQLDQDLDDSRRIESCIFIGLADAIKQRFQVALHAQLHHDIQLVARTSNCFVIFHEKVRVHSGAEFCCKRELCGGRLVVSIDPLDRISLSFLANLIHLSERTSSQNLHYQVISNTCWQLNRTGQRHFVVRSRIRLFSFFLFFGGWGW